MLSTTCLRRCSALKIPLVQKMLGSKSEPSLEGYHPIMCAQSKWCSTQKVNPVSKTLGTKLVTSVPSLEHVPILEVSRPIKCAQTKMGSKHKVCII